MLSQLGTEDTRRTSHSFSLLPFSSTFTFPKSCPPAMLFFSVGASEIRMSQYSVSAAAWKDALIGGKIEEVVFSGKIENFAFSDVNLGLIDGDILLTGGCSAAPRAVAHLTLSNGQAMVQIASMQALAFSDCDKSTALFPLASHVCSLRQSRAQDGGAEVLQCASLSAVDSKWTDMTDKMQPVCKQKASRWYASGGQLWCAVITRKTIEQVVTLARYKLNVPGGAFSEEENIQFHLYNSLPSTPTLRAIAATKHHLVFVVDTLFCVYAWDSNLPGSCQAMSSLVSNDEPNLQLSLLDGIVVAAVQQPDSDRGSTAVRVAGVIGDDVTVGWNTPQPIKVGSNERVWLLQGPLCGQNVRRQTGRARCLAARCNLDMVCGSVFILLLFTPKTICASDLPALTGLNARGHGAYNRKHGHVYRGPNVHDRRGGHTHHGHNRRCGHAHFGSGDHSQKAPFRPGL